jgi:HAD superfamily hydrolase (TIGR01509 family)
MLNAVIFDMDGVIVDSEPLHNKAYQRMFLDFNLDVSARLYESFTGQATRAICQRLCDEFNLKHGADDLVSKKRHHFNNLFEETRDFELIPGVLDLIEDYHKAGLTLILGSSASMQNINRIFKRFDIDKYFKAKFSGADLKASKPNPEIFIKAAAASGFLKENCFVIEDSTNGILAAKAAGLFCVGFESPNSKNQDYSKADLNITSLKEIHYSKIKTFF